MNNEETNKQFAAYIVYSDRNERLFQHEVEH